MKLRGNSWFRLFALAASLLFLCFPSYGNPLMVVDNPTREFRLARGQRDLNIPFEITGGGHIFLRVRVNGSEPLWFGLDSGAEQTLISTQQAKALNLKLYGEAQAAGGGENTVDFSSTKNVSLDVSGVNFKLKEVGVLPLAFASPVAGEAIAGILGYDFMSRFVIEINYPNQIINLYNPRSYRYRGRGEIVPIKMLDNNPCIAAKVRLPGLALVSGMFLIDSGANTDIFFNSPFVEKHKLLTSSQETTEAKTEAIGGTNKIRIGSATDIQIGNAIILKPTVHFSLATQGTDASDINAGFIGGKLLRQFKVVIFDQARRRLILEPNIQARRMR